jgi:hypothetical protein
MTETLSPKMSRLVSNLSMVLDVYASKGVCATYTQLAEALGGYNPRSKHLSYALYILLKKDFKEGKPIRSSLIINKRKGIPGDSYFTVLEEECGFSISCLRSFWIEQVRKVLHKHKSISIPN